MNTELLRTFIEVHRTRHFGKAAERLFITPSAVSARIRLLEQQLGTTLFTRDRNNIQITHQGQRLLPRAETLVLLWEQTRREVGGGSLPDKLSVAAPPSLWEFCLQPWLQQFCTKQPGVGLHLDSLSTDIIFHRLNQGLLDVGFVHEAPPPYELTLTPIGHRKLVLVSTVAGHHVDEAITNQYIQVEWGIAFANKQRELYPELITPFARVATAHLALDLLQHSSGSAYLPEAMIGQLISENRLYQVEGAAPIEIRIYASYNPQGIHAATITSSLACFAESVRGEKPPANERLDGNIA